jgi:GNAT superfamily N-acetyltransferase
MFDCGVPELDTWLKRRALQNDINRASRTFVVSAQGRVVGYYALATGAVAHSLATGRVRRNMPDPVPVMVLARLAVDQEFQGTGLGSDLLRDALLRTLAVADQAGIRAMLLHAISEEAKHFYVHHGFAESPVDPLVMMITLAEVERLQGR